MVVPLPPEGLTMRVTFEDVFRVELCGKITPKTRIRFGADPVITEVLHGTSVDPKNTKGLAIVVGKDLEVLIEGGVMVILRQYD
jgi:hypothetical protein